MAMNNKKVFKKQREFYLGVNVLSMTPLLNRESKYGRTEETRHAWCAAVKPLLVVG
jgi:hypothetical protein